MSEIKRLLKQYAFSLVVIFCLSSLLCGITVVREKTRYNMELTSYRTVSAEQFREVLYEAYEKITNLLTEN